MKTMLLFATLLLSTTTALAAPRPLPRVPMAGQVVAEYERRHDAQMTRITDGMRSGALTAGEVTRLMKRQQKLEKLVMRAISDRVLFPEEMRAIDAAFAKSSRQIDQLTRNSVARVSVVRFSRDVVLYQPAPRVIRAPRPYVYPVPPTVRTGRVIHAHRVTM